jgi:hypothetical protein
MAVPRTIRVFFVISSAFVRGIVAGGYDLFFPVVTPFRSLGLGWLFLKVFSLYFSYALAFVCVSSAHFPFCPANLADFVPFFPTEAGFGF